MPMKLATCFRAEHELYPPADAALVRVRYAREMPALAHGCSFTACDARAWIWLFRTFGATCRLRTIRCSNVLRCGGNGTSPEPFASSPAKRSHSGFGTY